MPPFEVVIVAVPAVLKLSKIRLPPLAMEALHAELTP